MTATAPVTANGTAQAPRYRVFAPFSDDTLCALEEAHGRVAVVRAAAPAKRRWVPNDTPEPPWEAVFREPTVGEAEAYEGHAHHEKARAGMVRNHAKATVVGVSIGGKQTVCMDRADTASVKAVREAWDRLRDRYGAAHLAAQDDLMALMGSVREEGKDE
jgi:hypothetical protein